MFNPWFKSIDKLINIQSLGNQFNISMYMANVVDVGSLSLTSEVVTRYYTKMISFPDHVCLYYRFTIGSPSDPFLFVHPQWYWQSMRSSTSQLALSSWRVQTPYIISIDLLLRWVPSVD